MHFPWKETLTNMISMMLIAGRGGGVKLFLGDRLEHSVEWLVFQSLI